MEKYEEIKYFLMITCQETSSKPYDRYHKGHQKKGYKYLRIII